MSNFDVANLALKAVCPSNEMLYDDKGMPSIMVKIPKCTWADLGIGTSTETFPAFIINGQEVDCIYFSKYINVVQNGRAYSLPGQNYANIINLDNSIARCTAKGEGWHLQTRLEWMAVALWCLKNGTLPWGNNNYGRDTRETIYKAIPLTYGSDGKINHTAGGTGPLTWSHNRQLDGIWDMNGNAWEWVGGIRTVNGELQVISHDGTFGNDAADPDNSQAAASSKWYAIDGTTGTLITPNGSGTTTNSLKMDRVDNKWKWITGTLTDIKDESRGNLLEQVTADSTVCEDAKHILQALGMLPLDGLTSGALEGDYLYANNAQAERSFCCGGSYASGASAGVFCASGSSSRASSGTYISLRSAYVKLPTA